MIKFLIIFLIFGHASSNSCAKAIHRLVKDQTYQFEQIEVPQINLILWNIQKGTDQDWSQDMSRLIIDKDLILIQEAHLTPAVTDTLKIHGYDWEMGKSFDYKGKPTGVLTLSNTRPHSTKVLLSKPTEPITNTPKATLISLFEVSGNKEKLMVINTHGINFVSNESYAKQMDAIAKVIKNHHGPLIWAGDFNTWNKKRLQKIMEIAHSNFLSKVPFPQGTRTTAPVPWSTPPLDHIFFRGLELEWSQVGIDIISSDHHPLEATLSFLKY